MVNRTQETSFPTANKDRSGKRKTQFKFFFLMWVKRTQGSFLR